MATVISSNTASDNELYSTYQGWIKTVQEEPGIMSMQLMTLWDVMASSDDEDVAKRNPDVQHAYQWVVSHPQEHWTKCRFVINSDWGEIGLLTPSAIILPDPEHPVDPSVLANTNLATTKITWGKEQSHSFQRDVTIDFIISNDGSPVDIELSHGSDGDSGGSGRCQVKFANSTDPYVNEGVKGNNWNTQWFYQCEVSSDVHVATEDEEKLQQNGHAK